VNPFEYTSARTADNAASLVAADGRYLAGGIDLLGEMKEYIAQPRRLVNVKELPGTHEITPGKDAWTLGANVTIAEIEQHPELRRRFPGLQQAAAEVGSPQIRNVATLAGNLAQHSRCWYYRHRDVRCATARTSITACSPATRASARSFRIWQWRWRRSMGVS
jgi:xanthine dehydrogenase YagS FAD-binding subunit